MQLSCATAGASIGYWIEHQDKKREMRTVNSWDFSTVFGLKNGTQVPAQPVWNIYDGETIALQPADKLHINAQRIGYTAAKFDYAYDPSTK